MSDISIRRLTSQQILATRFKSIPEMVSWMGAMQAQDYYMMKWAVGLRIPLATDSAVEESLAKGEVLRTHLLRPTWHLVSATDLRWILELTAPQIKPFIRNWLKRLELDGSVIENGKAILEKALSGQNHLTREEIARQLEQGNFSVSDLRLSHFLMACELDGLICSGKTKGKKQTYALLDERAPATGNLSKEEALHRLAERYFTSHGPATLQDFIWWSGLTIRDSRKALDLIKGRLETIKTDEREHYFLPTSAVQEQRQPKAFLVPAFDEFLISYRDRTDALEKNHHSKAISNNGIFRPTVVIDGTVAGLWKKVIRKGVVTVEYDFFRPIGKEEQKRIDEAESQYLQFLK
jgi:hypothetical protein